MTVGGGREAVGEPEQIGGERRVGAPDGFEGDLHLASFVHERPVGDVGRS